MAAEKAYAVCEPQADLAGRNAQNSSGSNSGSVSCDVIGNTVSCDRGRGSGFKAGAARALIGIMDRNRTRDAVMASCLAQHGGKD